VSRPIWIACWLYDQPADIYQTNRHVRRLATQWGYTTPRAYTLLSNFRTALWMLRESEVTGSAPMLYRQERQEASVAAMAIWLMRNPTASSSEFARLWGVSLQMARRSIANVAAYRAGEPLPQPESKRRPAEPAPDDTTRYPRLHTVPLTTPAPHLTWRI
jgi:hypothetical protein